MSKNNASSCHGLAVAFYNGSIINKDLNAAFVLFNKACKARL
ncbi:SEL1-like repeat protein [Campylobacter blaseri]|nr:SEL1-like repeat protein [Campylobacter blaseri]